MHDLPKLLQDLKDARQEVRNLTVMAMAPDLLPNDLELTRNLERLARLEVKLRLKHLAWLRADQSGSETRTAVQDVEALRCGA